MIFTKYKKWSDKYSRYDTSSLPFSLFSLSKNFLPVHGTHSLNKSIILTILCYSPGVSGFPSVILFSCGRSPDSLLSAPSLLLLNSGSRNRDHIPLSTLILKREIIFIFISLFFMVWYSKNLCVFYLLCLKIKNISSMRLVTKQGFHNRTNLPQKFTNIKSPKI